METTELRTWLENSLEACAYEGETDFPGELITYYRHPLNKCTYGNKIIEIFLK